MSEGVESSSLTAGRPDKPTEFNDPIPIKDTGNIENETDDVTDQSAREHIKVTYDPNLEQINRLRTFLMDRDYFFFADSREARGVRLTE